MKHAIGVAPGVKRNVTALALGAVLLLGTACGGGKDGAGSSDGKGGAPQPGATADTVASTATVSILPMDGASGVSTTGTLKVSAAGGKLASVVVKDEQGTPVPGRITRDGLGWQPTGHLVPATRYTVDASAKDAAGRESDKHSAFTTVTPKDTVVGFFTPEDGSTVGVGMEVYLNFNRPILNKKAVEDGVKVTASPAVPLAAHWYGNQRLYIRPQTYWTPGTKVTLGLNLKGVEAAPGVYGTQHKQVHFTIGRSQITIVDAARKKMTVYRDGKAIRTLPISAGAPAHTTYNGKMVISEKYVKTRMNGDTVGFGGEYDIKDVPHAMRLTESGTFIHGNYWGRPSVFGHTNTSHGCVGLRDARGAGNPHTPAAWFFANSMIGDVVEVVHSRDKTVQWYNGLNGWNLPWAQWTTA